jgi:lipopolysaccharide export system protein LptA
VDSANTLTSEIGKYFANTEEFNFRTNVKLHNTDYDMLSDTMSYFTKVKTVHFFGPTTAVSEDHILYTERGWYNTEVDLAKLEKNSRYKNKEKRMSADTIIYDKKHGIGKAYSRVVMHDTTLHATIYGDYAYYKEKPEYLYVVDSLVVEKVFDNDTLFLHADSLVVVLEDTAKKTRNMKAYHKVRFYKKDLQGKCDSMVYRTADSTLYMMKDPVLWSEKNQVSGTKIRIHEQKGEVDKIFIDKSAFLVSQDSDTLNFNQVKGVNMIAYIKEGNFWKLDVISEGQTLYYMRDGEELSGVNTTECENITVFFRDNEVDEVLFKRSPKGTMFPASEFNDDLSKLPDFKWLENIKPVSKRDIFNWR